MTIKSLADFVTTPLWQQVASGVRRAIQKGELLPGDRVVESQLAAVLGISRNPIREGLRQLQQKGILEYRANAGTVVAELQPSEAIVMLRTREYMESLAIELYFANSKKNRLDELDEILVEMEVAARDNNIELGEELDERFHTAIVRLSGSTVLNRVWEAVDPYTGLAIARRNVGLQSTPDLDDFVAIHQTIVDALRSADVNKAKQVVVSHLQNLAQLPQFAV